MGRWPSGQRQLTVNQPGKPYSGSNPLLPTKKKSSFVYQDKRGFFAYSGQNTAKMGISGLLHGGTDRAGGLFSFIEGKNDSVLLRSLYACKDYGFGSWRVDSNPMFVQILHPQSLNSSNLSTCKLEEFFCFQAKIQQNQAFQASKRASRWSIGHRGARFLRFRGKKSSLLLVLLYAAKYSDVGRRGRI